MRVVVGRFITYPSCLTRCDCHKAMLPLNALLAGIKWSNATNNIYIYTKIAKSKWITLLFKTPNVTHTRCINQLCHEISTTGRWKLHIWTTVTYLDDGGCISGRLLHIWTVTYLGVTHGPHFEQNACLHAHSNKHGVGKTLPPCSLRPP